MIQQLRKSCLDVLDRALTNLRNLRAQQANIAPKALLQKIHLVQNDIELLKDNFTLIATKILRIQAKQSQKQSIAFVSENKYKQKFEEVSEAYKILEAKHQKLGKELSFIKFSNNSLRKEIQSIQDKDRFNKMLRKGMKDIQNLVQTNGENLEMKINFIINNIENEEKEKQKEEQEFNYVDFYSEKLPSANLDFLGFAEDFSIKKPTTHLQMPFKQQRQTFPNCQSKSQYIKTKKKQPIAKQNSEMKQSISTEKKKKNQLARLVQQQGRLVRRNERYMSNDLL